MYKQWRFRKKEGNWKVTRSLSCFFSFSSFLSSSSSLTSIWRFPHYIPLIFWIVFTPTFAEEYSYKKIFLLLQIFVQLEVESVYVLYIQIMLIDPPADTSGRSTFRPMVQNKFSRQSRTGNGYIPCKGYQPCQVLAIQGLKPYKVNGYTRVTNHIRYWLDKGYQSCQVRLDKGYQPWQVHATQGLPTIRYRLDLGHQSCRVLARQRLPILSGTG
jgi:hypothetical protein